MLQVSHLFKADALAAQFDEQAADQASKGRVFAPLTVMLESAYGVTLPTATVAAIKAIQNFMAFDKAPKLAEGPGSRATPVIVWQALHAYGTALLAGMGAKSRTALPTALALAPLPAWACPVALASKKAAADEKRKATAEEKAKQAAADEMALQAGRAVLAAQVDAASADAPADVPADAQGLALALAPTAAMVIGAPRDMAAEMRAAWSVFAAFLPAGLMTATERDGFIAALETATVAAEVVKTDKAAKKARKTAQAEADRASNAATLATFKAVPKVVGKVEVQAAAVAAHNAAAVLSDPAIRAAVVTRTAARQEADNAKLEALDLHAAAKKIARAVRTGSVAASEPLLLAYSAPVSKGHGLAVVAGLATAQGKAKSGKVSKRVAVAA